MGTDGRAAGRPMGPINAGAANAADIAQISAEGARLVHIGDGVLGPPRTE